jgi:hypothetical protein
MVDQESMWNFLRYFVERFDARTDARLSSIETNVSQITQNTGVIMANFADFTASLDKLAADVAAVKAQSDNNSAIVAENETLKADKAALMAQIEELKAQVAAGGMTAAEEDQVLARINELEAQIPDAVSAPVDAA